MKLLATLGILIFEFSSFVMCSFQLNSSFNNYEIAIELSNEIDETTSFSEALLEEFFPTFETRSYFICSNPSCRHNLNHEVNDFEHSVENVYNSSDDADIEDN